MQDGAAHSDARGARFQHAVHVVLGDPPDRKPWKRGRLGCMANVTQPRKLGLGEFLGRAGEDGPDAEVAAPARIAASSCDRSWVETPISAAGPMIAPGVARRQIVLAHMHAVAARESGEVNPVVHDEWHPRLRRQDTDLSRRRSSSRSGRPFSRY